MIQIMECSLSKVDLKSYVKAQCESYFPDKYSFSGSDVDKAINLSLQRLEYCFSHIAVRNYHDKNGNTNFYHLHSDQYSQWLYYLANSLWQISENRPLCDKLILLNRVLHNCWFSYKNHLPDIFILVHPIGTILGNAMYSDYLVVLQNVTINTMLNSDRTFALHCGKGLFCGANAKIIGKENIGDRVSLGIDSCVYKRHIPSDMLVQR